MKNVVILGGSYAGVSTAHRLLKHVAKTPAFKITLVSPDTHFYWSMASPRGLLPGQIAEDKLFEPIAAGFDKYPKDQFEFMVATAQGLEPEKNTVQISNSSGVRMLEYDILIIATGSHAYAQAPFKSLGSTDATKAAVHNFQEQVNKSKRIVVAGAGVTGVELAGELGFEYGKNKSISLVASGSTLVPGSPASVATFAIRHLESLNVSVKLEARVVGSYERSDGSTELTLSDGSKTVCDMYIPTFGLIPNSSYIPVQYLDTQGFVTVDTYLRVKGTKNIWAIGDVSNIEPPQFITCDKQSAHLSKSIVSILNNREIVPYKVSKNRFLGFSLGRNSGTGYFGAFKVPTFIIARARKTLFIENMVRTVNGSLF